MDPLRQYDIAFVGLKKGVTKFNYSINDKFFELFEGSLVKNAAIEAEIDFNKQHSFFELKFYFEGTVHLPCDRCSAELDYPVNAEYTIVIKFDEHNEEEKDDSLADVVYISRSETHFNTAQLIYEFINLSIPINHITCDNIRKLKPCNQEVLDQLNHQSINEPAVDHRWDDLNKIKFN